MRLNANVTKAVTDTDNQADATHNPKESSRLRNKALKSGQQPDDLILGPSQESCDELAYIEVKPKLNLIKAKYLWDRLDVKPD